MNSLDASARLRILRIVERFEDAWRFGERPLLEDLVRESVGEERAELLWQALSIELEYRRRGGEDPTLEVYARRFPEDLDAVRAAFEGERTRTWPRVVWTDSEHIDTLLADPLHTGRSSHPERIGKYEVLGRLGGGGQGSALLARDTELGRLVVLKHYHASGEGAMQEGTALCRVRSRHTATCLDLCRHEGERFLVTEYIPGRSLSEVLRKGPLVPGAAARLIEQVAEGLEAVHACGLVHRDIKPSNIVVGDDGVPRLVDFGLAAHLGSAALHGVSGTPQYMSPEQARDQWERIDTRTDIYGLGAVLYALLTGLPPHPGKTAAEALERAREGVLTPPCEQNRSIPRPLERIVLRALAADPGQRYSTATELRMALKSYCRRPLVRAAAWSLALLAVLFLQAWIWPRPWFSPPVPVAAVSFTPPPSPPRATAS
jgi:serine/threonine protein kinase